MNIAMRKIPRLRAVVAIAVLLAVVSASMLRTSTAAEEDDARLKSPFAGEDVHCLLNSGEYVWLKDVRVKFLFGRTTVQGTEFKRTRNDGWKEYGNTIVFIDSVAKITVKELATDGEGDDGESNSN